MRAIFDHGLDDTGNTSLDYGEEDGTMRTADPTETQDEEARRQSQWAEARHIIDVHELQPLFDKLQSMLDKNGRLAESSSREVHDVHLCLKEAIHWIHGMTRNDQKTRPQRPTPDKTAEEAAKRKWSHMHTPGGVVLAPVLEPLGNVRLPVVDHS